jgi:hypothetical protein
VKRFGGQLPHADVDPDRTWRFAEQHESAAVVQATGLLVAGGDGEIDLLRCRQGPVAPEDGQGRVRSWRAGIMGDQH